MIIQSNMNAINANNRLGTNVIGVRKSSEKLASGLRINRAADDAAGLGISEKMRAQIRGLAQGIRNTNDGISLTNTADGYLEEITAMHHRLLELSVQASNDTYGADERAMIQLEIDQLVQEIDDLTERAEFNGIKLFRGNMDIANVNIQHSEPEFVTITPECPAIVIGSQFGIDPVTGDSEVVRIEGGTNISQSAGVTGETGFHITELGANFPQEGIFVVRVGIPGGMLPEDLPAIVPPRDVVLDFGVLNADGNFTLADFEAFFIGTPTGTTRTDFWGDTMPVYAGGAFSDLINADEMRFSINSTTGVISVETTGLGGTRAQIGIGITNMTAADWTRYNGIHGTSYTVSNVKYANSAIFGATAQNSIGNNANAIPAGFNLDSWLTNPASLGFGSTFDVGDGVNRPVRVAPITPANESFQPQLNAEAQRLLREHYMDCTVFWDFLVASQGGTTFSLTMQQQVANPNFPGLIRDAITGNPIVPNRQEPEFLFPSHSSTEASNTPWLPIIGDTRYLGHPVTVPATYQTAAYSQSINQLNAASTTNHPTGATTLRNANNVFNDLRNTTMISGYVGGSYNSLESVPASTFFASANIGSIPAESLHVDREGNVRFNWGTTALNPSSIPARTNGSGSGTSDYPSPNYRILVGTAPNGSSYYAPVPTGTAAATITSGIRTSAGFMSTTPIYPARVSQSGTLEIRISKSGTSSVLPQTATVEIDFSNPQFSPSAPPDSPAAIQAMVNYINAQLNAPANRPNPLISFRDTDYVNLLANQSTIQGQTLNYTDFPVGFAYIDSSGRLAIATAEHNFQINVTEEQTDFPMFAMHRSASSGSPSPATLIITGTPTGTMSQSIPLEAGKYANANEFQQAHSHLFAPNYSLSVDNNRLVITSVATGAAVNVSNISVTPTAFAPLLQQFGLRSVDVHSPMRNSPDSSPIRETRPQRNGFPIPGITWSSYEEQLPDEIVRVDIGLKAKGLWIQGRDRNGTDQGLFIFLPYISASRLKFAEYTPPRFEIPDELKDVDRSLIHYEYLDRGEDTDVKRGLDVLTRENANLAIDTVRSSLTIINMERARFGAATNALEHMKAATTVTHENIMSAESRIRDTDMAMAMVDFTKNNILMQAAQAMLAQANQAPQAILQLLR